MTRWGHDALCGSADRFRLRKLTALCPTLHKARVRPPGRLVPSVNVPAYVLQVPQKVCSTRSSGRGGSV